MQLDEAVGRLEGFKDSSEGSTRCASSRTRATASARCRQRAVPERARPGRDHPVEGHPRAARGGRRRLRGRRGRARGDLRQEPVVGGDALLVVVILTALGVRLHQRLPRHGERDRDLGVDARDVAAPGSILATIGNLPAPSSPPRSRRRSARASSTWASSPSRRCSRRCSARSHGTWSRGHRGLPSSSSHALIGGLIGAALVQSGVRASSGSDIWHKVVIPGILSPIIGFIGAFVLLLDRSTGASVDDREHRANRSFRIGQLFSGTSSPSRTARTTRRRRWA